jgi:hypothetical protein
LFSYFGPETVLPLASVVATVIGAILMFGRLSLKFALMPFRRLWKKADKAAGNPALRGPIAWRRSKDEVRAKATSPPHKNGGEA